MSCTVLSRHIQVCNWPGYVITMEEIVHTIIHANTIVEKIAGVTGPLSTFRFPIKTWKWCRYEKGSEWSQRFLHTELTAIGYITKNRYSIHFQALYSVTKNLNVNGPFQEILQFTFWQLQYPPQGRHHLICLWNLSSNVSWKMIFICNFI